MASSSPSPSLSPSLRPILSVIMPAYNSAAVLARAVTSVQNQSFADWELLIVDDASQDGTAKIAAQFAEKNKKIILIKQGINQGAAAARNRAIAHARGRYIAFLDADDEWLPEKLDQQIPAMKESGAALCYSGFWRQKTDHDKHRVRVPTSVTRKTLLRGNVIGCLTAIYDRDQLGTVLMPDLPMRHDFALWLDILARIDHAIGIDAPLAIYHQSPTSLTGNKWRAQLGTWRMFRRHLGLPHHLAAFYLVSHLIQRLKRG